MMGRMWGVFVVLSVSLVFIIIAACYLWWGHARFQSQVRAEVLKYRSADPIIEAGYIYYKQNDRWPLGMEELVKHGLLAPQQRGDWEIAPRAAGDSSRPPVLFRNGIDHMTFFYYFDLGDTAPPYQNWEIGSEGTPIDWKSISDAADG